WVFRRTLRFHLDPTSKGKLVLTERARADQRFRSPPARAPASPPACPTRRPASRSALRARGAPAPAPPRRPRSCALGRVDTVRCRLCLARHGCFRPPTEQTIGDCPKYRSPDWTPLWEAGSKGCSQTSRANILIPKPLLKLNSLS